MQTRKFPRTMNEAFGPYASGPITEPNEKMPVADKLVLALSIAVAAVIVVMAFAGWLPGGVL